MHKHLKIRSLILVTLIVASFLTVTFLPTTTLAVDNKKSPNENARALGYFYTLRRCIAETFSSRTSLTSEQINNFSWLTGYKLPLGAQFISSNGDWDGNVNCDGGGEYGGWRQDAVRALGYSSNRDLLCNIINPYQSLSADESNEGSRSALEAEYNNCVKGQGNLDVSQLVAAKNQGSPNKNDSSLSGLVNKSVGQKFFGDPSPIASNGAELPLQQLFYTTFQKFCQPTDYNGGTVGNDLRKVSIKKFDSASSSYKSVEVLVKADRINKQTDVIAHNTLPSGEGSTMNCQQIIDKTNGYADKAQAIYDALPKETRNEIASGINSSNNNTGGDSSNLSSCAVEGVGWIVCPIAGFLGMMTDGLFGVLTTLLSFTPVQENEATYNTWQAMRNIANAAFVIAFLIIIFSQLTGAGITNYGIKKMVPRLIAAAILVNVSFFICQIAVDLSNILGYSLQSLMTNAAKTASGESNNLDVWGELVGWILAGAAGTLTIGGTVLAISAAGGWIPALALLLPVLVTVLFAILTVVLVLAARQALIIILIVISPLAFVAYLLPNTEDWFHKWRKLFITLLLMFPIISVIFGGSQLAAAVIRAGTDNPLIYILSLAVQVIPFFLVPIIMKTAGGLLNRFGGMVNNPNKGPFDRLRKRAENYAGYKVNDAASRNLKYKGNANRFSFAGSARRKAERESIYNSADNRAKEAGVEYIGGRLAPDEVTGDPTDTAFARKMAGSDDTNAIMMAMARGASAVDEIEAKELKAAQVILSNARVDGENLLALSGGSDGKGLNGQTVKGSAIMQMAASASLFAQGRQMDTVVENLLTSAHDPSNAADKKRILDFTVGQIQSSYPKAKEKQVGLTDEALMKGIADGNVTASNLSESLKASAAKKAADLSVDFLASQEKSSMEYIQAGMQSVTPDKAEKIRATSIKVTQTPSAIAKTNKDTYGIIEQISQSSPNTQIPGQGTFF